jgi:PAS domain S-box-containing protein
MTGLHLDVTERKIAEEARRKTEELYRTMTSNFPNGGVVLFDQNLRYTLAEGKGLATVGLSKKLMEGKTIWEALSPETCEVLEPAYRAALDGRETVFETTYNNRVFLVQVLPVKNEQGEVFAGMSMLQDITESKRSKQALLEERNFVSAILDIAAAFILVCDPQGRFIRVNRACEQITGYSIDEIKGKYLWDLFLIPEEVEPVKALVRELESGQFPNEYDNYWVMRDGNRRLISWSNTVLLDSDGSVKYLVSVGIDITERKRTEEIRRALEREQELSELRLRFFSMASHEFRTPLSTILLTAQILESSAHEGSTQKRLRNLRRISSAAKSMTQLLNDILTINRAETGKLEFNFKSIALENFCQLFLKEIQLNAGSQHTLTFSTQGKCQNALIDERLLRYILTNLLTNAIKYSPDGGEVHLALTCEPGKVSFHVHDQGIGIPLSDQPHLFEAFHRGGNIGNIPGSGLGLTVVKKCVDLHGGKISVTSEVGVGTTFTVTLPVT